MRAAALMLMAASTACAVAAYGWDAAVAGSPPAVVLTTAHVPATLRQCEPVTWRFRVLNRGPRTARLRFRSGQRGDLVLRRRDGTEVYRWSKGRGFTLALWSRAVAPSGAWSFELTDRLRVPGGRYLMVARVTATSSVQARLSVRRWVRVVATESCGDES